MYGGATEEEFMAYANSVIAQYMDTSDSRIILKTYIYEYSEEYGKSSIVATVNPDKEFTIGIRADMDALPIKEVNDIPFKSKII